MGLFDGTLGAASIGFSISCVVFGVLTTQVVVYFQRFPHDRVIYKFLVAILWGLELLDQFFIGHSLYYYTITHYGEPQIFASGEVVFTLVLQIVAGNLVGTLVKMCFAMRVWRFSNKNKIITGSIVVLVSTQFGLAIAYSVKAFQLSVFDGHKHQLIASLALAGGLLTDILIASALCYFLRRLRTGYRKADTLVNTLSIYAVNTGALTGAISLLTLLLYNCLPDTFAYMSSYFTLGKFYAISFLATLNTRKVLRGRGTYAEGESENTSNARNTFFMVAKNGRAPRDAEYASRSKSLEIDIRREVSVMGDEHAEHDASMVIPDHIQDRKM